MPSPRPATTNPGPFGRLPRWLSAALFLAALGAAAWRIPRPEVPRLAPAPTAATALPAFFRAEFLPATVIPGEPTLTLLADGRLAAAWSAEQPAVPGQRLIWFSRRDPDGWLAPLPAATRESTAGGTFIHVDAIGRPLLYAEGSWLHLWFVSHDAAGGETLKHSVSTNAGKRWSAPENMPLAPLALGELRFAGPPQALDDGGLGLNISRNGLARRGTWLRLTANGRPVDQVSLSAPLPTRLPALDILDARRAVSIPAADGKLPVEPAAPRALPDAGGPTPPAVLRLPDGDLLLAGNTTAGRGALALWLSRDEGRSWQLARLLENAADGAADFGDPALLAGRDGSIYLAYAWRRRQIKLLHFSPAWLRGETR